MRALWTFLVALALATPAWAGATALPTVWQFSDGKSTRDVTVPGEVPAQGFVGFEGFGHYRVTVQGEALAHLLRDRHADEALALGLGPAEDAYEVSINGIPVGHAGTLTDDPAVGHMAAQHSYVFRLDDALLAQIAAVHADRWDLDVKLWSDPTHARAFNGAGGFLEGTYLIGNADEVAARADAERWSDTVHQIGPRLLVWVMLVIAGGYSLLLYARRRELYEYFWFGLMGTFLGVGQIFWFLRDFGFIDDFWTVFRIFGRQFFFYGVASFLYFCIYFARTRPRLIDKLAAGTLAFLGLGQAITTQLHPLSLQLGRPLLLVCVVLSVYRICQAVLRKVPDSKTILVGILFLCADAVYIVIEGQRWVHLPMPSADLAPYPVFMMLLSIGAALLNRFTRAYGDLDVKNVELLRMDKIKDEFLANTSHELRTPLNGIIGIAESLIASTDAQDGPLDVGHVRKNLELVVTSGRRLSSLVNDIVDFSKLRHHTIELRRGAIDVRAASDVVISLIRASGGERQHKKNLELINNIPADFPLIDGDEDRIQQILYNVIGNAVKFTSSGSVVVEAAVDAGGGLCRVSVRDTGIGIPADVIGRIFNSFEQGDGSTAREYGGTGLGLAVSRQLVELHGGTITATSRGAGFGTTVSFTLPLSKTQDTAARAPSPSTAARLAAPTVSRNVAESATTATTASPPALARGEVRERTDPRAQLHRFCVLVVDDEPINLQVIDNQLSLHRYEVLLAEDGFAALRMLDEMNLLGRRPDIILSDVMMPRMSGYELTRKIRELYPDEPLPIMLLTAKNRESDIVEGFTAGASDYLTKPFSQQELVARVQAHLKICKMDAAARRFVPFEILNILGKDSLIDVDCGDSVYQPAMSILFSDIRSFTSISEKHSPQEVFTFINEYLSRMEPSIHDNDGFVNQYLGDGIMALFHRRPDDAVHAAVQMHRTLRDLNPTRVAQGRFPIQVGIGINTGPLILGTVGGGERLDCNVIGDAVNLASRVEGMTKFYRAQVLITDGTVQGLQPDHTFQLRAIDRVLAKGKEIPIGLYEVLDAEAPARRDALLAQAAAFAEALVHYQAARFVEARALFASCDAAVPDGGDGVAQLYVERCTRYEAAPAGFDGVTRWDEK